MGPCTAGPQCRTRARPCPLSRTPLHCPVTRHHARSLPMCRVCCNLYRACYCPVPRLHGMRKHSGALVCLPHSFSSSAHWDHSRMHPLAMEHHVLSFFFWTAALEHHILFFPFLTAAMEHQGPAVLMFPCADVPSCWCSPMLVFPCPDVPPCWCSLVLTQVQLPLLRPH